MSGPEHPLERLLCDPSLPAKLAPLTLDGLLAPPPSITLPLVPARPEPLRFARPGQRAPFPRPHALADGDERAVALHHFANHELLALELMALALLRFPNAPQGFRRGLAGALIEEQRHLAGYVARLAAHGAQFGDLPVNDYFWRALAPLERVESFVAGMSLTLEQANLDFTLQYKDLFLAAGDAESAALLEQIHNDEIGHVRHGAEWLPHLLGPEALTPLERYRRALPPGLSLVDARGGVFAADARRAAGLDAELIHAVERARIERERPDLLLFNPDLEEELIDGSPTRSQIVESLRRDLSGLCLWLARPGDRVVMDPAPTPEALARLERAGMLGVQVLPTLAAARGRAWGALRPFAHAPSLLAPAAALDLATPFWAVPPALADKARAVELLPAVLEALDDPWPSDLLPGMVDDRAALGARLEQLATAGHTHALIKAPLGASGRHRIKLALDRPPTPELEARIHGLLEAQGHLRVEAWLELVAELSVQLDLSREDPVLGLGRFFTAPDGRYRGHLLGTFNQGLDAAVCRALPPRRVAAALERSARRAAQLLSAAGYKGPAGVDAFIFKDPRAPSGLRLHPLSEINPRCTMGHVALRLRARLHPGRVGLWRLLAKAEISRPLEQWPPLTLDGRTGRWSHGVLATTDPATAKHVLSLVAIGESLAEAEQIMAGLGADQA